MGYFANGTEGEAYEHNVCSRCIHLFWNYEQEEGSTVESIMHTLIPRRGIYNDLCSMYMPSKPEYATHGEDYKAWLERKG